MAILKCKMCGGDIIKNTADDSIGTCESCGTVSTLPNIDDDRLANFFNRADYFRRLGEFDRAISAYENILAGDPSIAEAYWGVVLSRFGIEYVEDPDTHKRVPTCHRASYDSILTDADYLNVLQHADMSAKELYISEAQQIDAIQKEILAVAETEAPFDIFISYKDTTDGGNRTIDSVLAQDLYEHLTREGYHVFFSRISLEDKLGEKYEPHIFSALNSAKAMILVTTDPENVKSTWVRNEWSRYLSLKRKQQDRVLIVCYRGMDPNDLPDELAVLQCQDMSKIGFEQDLIRGLKKVLKKQATDAKDPVDDNDTQDINKVLRRGQILLEDGDWESAHWRFDRALDLNPECAEAYVGKLYAELRCSDEKGLIKSCSLQIQSDSTDPEFPTNFVPLTRRCNYNNAVKFGDAETKKRLNGYNDRVQEILRRTCEEIQEKISECERKTQYKRDDLANCEKKEQNLTVQHDEIKKQVIGKGSIAKSAQRKGLLAVGATAILGLILHFFWFVIVGILADLVFEFFGKKESEMKRNELRNIEKILPELKQEMYDLRIEIKKSEAKITKMKNYCEYYIKDIEG